MVVLRVAPESDIIVIIIPNSTMNNIIHSCTCCTISIPSCPIRRERCERTLLHHSSSSNIMNIAPYGNSDLSSGCYADSSNDTHRSINSRVKSFQQRIGEVHPSFWGYRYVIFPESFAAQLWDSIIIVVTFYNALWIPYEFGISGGYIKMTSDGFIVFNIVVDLCFFGMY